MPDEPDEPAPDADAPDADAPDADAPASPDAPAPDAAAAPPAPRGPRRAIVLGAIAAALAIALVVVVALGRGGAGDRGAASGDGGAGAGGFAGGAPAGPSLPRAGRPGDGPARLPGAVVDASGAPVGDVAITATLELGPGDHSGAPDPDATPPEVVAYAAADGTFVLEGLAPGRHRLRVEGADIFTAEVRFVPVPADGVRVVVARRVEITGVVVDGGRPVPGARVTVDGDALGGRLDTVTDAAGAFGFDALPEGSYRVWAHETDLASRAVRVPRLGAGPFAPVTLTLEPATIVVGRVVDRATGIGVEAAVSLEPVALDGAPPGDDADAPRFARTGADGVFRVEGVPHGRWLLDAWAPGWLSTGALELQAGRSIVELELTAGGIVEGTVVDALGRPVVGAQVVARGEAGRGRTFEASADVDADRLRRFSGLAPAGVHAPALAAGVGPPGDFTTDPRFVPRGELGVLLGPIPFPPPPGTSTTRQAQIVGAPVGAPVAVAPAGAPDAGGGATVGAAPILLPPSPIAIDPAYAATRVTDDRGRFRLTGLEAATWTVIASAPGMADGRSAPVALATGKVVQGVEVVLSPGTYVEGTATSARGGPLVGVTIAAVPRAAPGDPVADADRGRVVAVTDADGHYRMGPLVGDVTMTASAWGFGDAVADVALPPPTGEVAAARAQDFVLTPADAQLRGRVLDPDRLPVRGASIAVEAGAARGRRAVTDDDGWFEILAVPPGPATVGVEHAGFPPQRFPIDTARDAAIALAWGGGVAGVVFDHHTGAPIAGVTVTLVGPAGRREVATGPDGALEATALVAGAYTLRVQVPGYLVVERAVDVPAGRGADAITARDLRVELERGALLAGVIRDAHGRRVAGATVTASRDDGGRVEARTDVDGEFRLRDVPTGEITVRASRGDLAGSSTITLRPGDEVLSFALDLK